MRLVLGSLVLLVCSSRVLCAQLDNETTRKTLAGLRGVSVEVHIVGDRAAMEQEGVSENDLQAEVEQRLRLSGITILSRSEMPTLMLRVGGHKGVGAQVRELYAFVVEIRLFESVCSRSASPVCLNAPTWTPNGSVLGFAGSKKLVDTIRDDVQSQTDAFISAYLAMNPRR